MNTVVKKWLKDKEFGFLENGSGPDILVRKADLIKCQYLKVGVNVEFECHIDKKILVARKVRLIHKIQTNRTKHGNNKTPYFGVMT